MENLPMDTAELKFIAQEFPGMIVDIPRFMVENPVTVLSSTNMDTVIKLF